MAANPAGAETRFETKDGRKFVAVFDIDAICALEDLRDRPVVQILVQVLQGRIGFVRDALWCGLRRHHDAMTLAEVGELMRDIEGANASEIVTAALKASFPAPKKPGEGDARDPRPALDETGTGTNS